MKALPWVGIALEITSNHTGGRVFCVLPMPNEVSCHLPVHVDATFSLNDERRELKWSGFERKNDDSAEWNTLIIKHLLPPCYASLLLNHAKQLLTSEGFYRAWPDVNMVRYTSWQDILSPFFGLILSHMVFYSHNNHWVSKDQACFIPEESQVPSVVTTLLSTCRESVVKIPHEVWEAFTFMHISVVIVTPKHTRLKIKRNKHMYTHYIYDQKLELLRYCLSDGAYGDLEGLALLPLKDGPFKDFLSRRNNAELVYMCSSQYPSYLIPSCGNQLVDISSDQELYEKLLGVAKINCTQLTILDTSGVQTLLRNCLPNDTIVRLPHNFISLDWLKLFWEWVPHNQLWLFSELLVVPVYNTLDEATYVVRLSRNSPAVFSTTSIINGCLRSALGKLHVKICELTRFPFIHVSAVSLMNQFSADGVLDAVHLAKHYRNVTLTTEEATALRYLLHEYTTDRQRQSTLQELSIFSTLSNTSRQLYSIRHGIITPNHFPLNAENLPTQLVLFSNSELMLLLRLSVQQPTSIDLLVDSVFPLIRNHFRQAVPLMKELLEKTLEITYNADARQKNKLKSAIEILPFLQVFKDGQKLHMPRDLFDPSQPLLQDIFAGEFVFPLDLFCSDKCLAALRACGLKTKVSPQEVIDVIFKFSDALDARPRCVDEVTYRRAKAILKTVETWREDVLSQRVTLQSQVFNLSHLFVFFCQKKCLLPVKVSPPQGYPDALEWKGQNHTSYLIPNGPLTILSQDKLLELSCGSQAYFIDHSLPTEICNLLSPNSETLVKHVMAHLAIVVNTPDMSQSEIITITQSIYQVLSSYHSCTVRNKALLPAAFIFIRQRNQYVSPCDVALSQNKTFHQNLEPFIYTLPDSLYSFSSLFKALGVEETVSKKQILSVLSNIKKSNPNDLGVRNDEAWSFVMTILHWLTGNGTHIVAVSDCSELYVPVEDCTSEGEGSSSWPKLVESKNVIYTDNDFLRRYISTSDSREHSYEFVNQRISPQMAHQLRLAPLSKYLKISEDAFEDVGQCEPLTVRLKNILKDYKDGLTIIKELLQNADDANATEVNICYDARNHTVSSNSLLFPGMAGCHGPALVVHNNAKFTQEDFKNITKLAGATKESQTLKIGKFGVGFCSVYHMTDIPSFISDEYLFVFDPTLTYLKEEIKNPAQPGKKVRFTTSVVVNSQQLTPYDNLFDFIRDTKYNGTMFRFPFRTTPSELSENIYTRKIVENMFDDIRNSSSKLLLFLQSIKCITVSQIGSDDDSPTQQLMIKKNERKLGSVTLVMISCTYYDGSKDTGYWLVSKHTETVLRKIATASVACSISILNSPQLCLKPKETCGEVFCFLPLSMKTGLPVHVSSNFAVSNNRTAIWSSDDPSKNIYEVKWNESLMQTVIPEAYFQLLLGLKQINNTIVKEYTFHTFWPLKTELAIHNPWNLLLRVLYHKIDASTLFYSASIAKWLSLPESRFLSTDILSTSSTLPKCVPEVATCLKFPIVNLPQQYYAHLDLYKQNMVTEKSFLEVFFIKIHEVVPIETRNDVLCLALECFTKELDHKTERREYLRSFLSSNNCIPCAPDGKMLRRSRDMVNPKAAFANLYEEQEGFFPHEEFCQKPLVSKAMEVLGIIDSPIPMIRLLERAETIQSLYNRQCHHKALERSKLIVKCLQAYYNHYEEDKDSIASIKFLPVMPKPKHYILNWFGERDRLLSGEELMLRGNNDINIILAGSQIPFIHELEPKDDGCGHIGYLAERALKLRTVPTPVEVVHHLVHLIEVFESHENKGEDVLTEINTIVHKVYRFLDDELRKQKNKNTDSNQLDPDLHLDSPELDLCTLSSLPCIWKGKQFISCDKAACEWKLSDGPYLYRVPDSYKTLWEVLEIRAKFSFDNLLNALQEISNDYDGCKVPNEFREIVNTIISELNTSEIPEQHPVIMLPDEHYIMHKASSLAYNDAPWVQRDATHTYVNKTLARNLAEKLGVNMVRNKILDSFRQPKPEWSERFGQNEKLTTRIQGILKDYPFDVTILKELLQNADDAKATKFYVILDTRTHKGKCVLSEKWEELQGPALLAWNDKEFTEGDIEGIQKLGMGNKQSNTDTIGQYGIGFNSVYHLTDCPSFISGGRDFCIFDPHCRYTPDSTKEFPGERFKLSETFWTKFPDMKPAYLQSNIQDCPEELLRGSLFRFPLRHTQELVEASEMIGKNVGSIIFEGVLTADKMLNHLTHWAPQMKQSMFFLNNITEIRFLTITEENNNLKLMHHYRVDIDKAAAAERKKLHGKVQAFNGGEPFITKYQLSLVEVGVSSERKERWLIQQGIGDIKNKEQQWRYIQQVKPRHGIAAPLNHSKGPGRFLGKVFCFLPLPINCNLPVHINGHFILHSNRRSLWRTTDKDDVDTKQQWNKYLLVAIASSYAHFLITAKQDYKCESGNIVLEDLKRYYRAFPSWTAPKSTTSSSAAMSAEHKSETKHHQYKYQQNVLAVDKAAAGVVVVEEALPTDEWLILCKYVFKALADMNAPILAVVHSVHNVSDHKSKHTVEWCCLLDSDRASQVYFPPRESPNSVLERIGMKLAATPHWIRKHFLKMGCTIPEVSATTVYQYYCQFNENVLLSEADSFPCPLRNTSFQSIDNFKMFLKFVLPAIRDIINEASANVVRSKHQLQSVEVYSSEKLQISDDYTPVEVPPILEFPPLIVTADGILQPYSDGNESKVIKTSFSTLFQQCLKWFLHPELSDIDIPKTFILSPSEKDNSTCLKRVEMCISSILPSNLYNVSCEQCPNQKQLNLKSVWKCLSEDEFFRHFVGDILEKWALLLSKDNKLYSCCLKEQAVLPILPLPHTRSSQEGELPIHDMRKVSTVYQHLNLPFLNTEIVPREVVNTICPTLSDPKLMLQLLHNFNNENDILPHINANISHTLIDYFSSIHLKKDAQSLEYLKHLPLFLTYTGKFTSLNGKTVYEWPRGMCTAGEIIWLSRSNVVFLDRDGAWSKLTSELGVCSIHQVEIYIKYVFQHFCTMDESVRLEHLQYIRDYLFQDVINHSQNNWAYRQFHQVLYNLRCIGSDNSDLRAVKDFYDIKNKIFKSFEDKYLFLPTCFRASERLPRKSTREQKNEADRYYVKWRDFFKNLGMHCEVTPNVFLELCQEMANGQHVRNTKAKSRVLFEHLFKYDTEEWFSKSNFVSRVVEISFVLADEGEHYIWIAPVESRGTCVIQTDEDPVCLTKLNGACTYDDIGLVWTVKPVYRTPWLERRSSTVLLTNLKLKHYRATVSDVVQHLINISGSGRANPALFDTYTAPCPGEHDIGLIDVIAKCFEFLNKNIESIKPYDVDILKMTPCIPVPASKFSSNKIVLIKPSQALTTDVSMFFPYLHVIPYELMSYIKLLERIGVKTSINLCHFQLVLRLLHEKIFDEKMDPNIVDMVCRVIDNLKIKVHDDEQTGKELSPLYLPGRDNCLHLSLDLVYPDTYNYKLCQLPESNTDFCLLHHPNTQLDQFDFANSFCNHLPKAVRPKPLSEFCFQKLALECTLSSNSEDIDMARHLKTALKLNMLPIACKSMLLKDGSDCRHRLENVEERLSSLFQRVEVITVENLKVDVVLRSDESKIGSANVDYFLYQECNEINCNFCLYLDSRIGRMEEEHIHTTMAKELLGAVSKIVTGTFLEGIPDKLHHAFSLFLKSQTDSDIRRACQICGINMEDAVFVQAFHPAIGNEIPEAWHFMLDQNPYNIFHPQEIVGYERADGCYIFAQVLYMIPQDDNELGGSNTLLTKYMIFDLQHEQIVTALDIYKFVTQSRDNRAIPYNEEEVIEEEINSTNAAETKRRLCAQLRRIWELSEPERSKAIRRLYLKWHPDKNLDNVDLASDVFKFLVKQIDRLNQGLDLDEDLVLSSSDIVSPSSSWRESFSSWEQTAQSHRRHRSHHSDYFQARGGVAEHESFYKPQPNYNEGARWVKQAEIDLKALETLYEEAIEDNDLSSHVCFMAHEVAEKALKGGVYAICGLGEQYLKNHEIQLLANMLRGEKCHLASELPSLTSPLVRYYLDTRFPNRWGVGVIPSQQYSITDAEQARERARKILQIVISIVSECVT